MHLELVQALRCPADHQPTWLVARTDRLEARHITAGVLGCPECGAEYPIARGVLRLGAPIRERATEEIGADPAIRAAALLGLTTPNGVVLLAGAWAHHAVEVAALTEGVHVIALDAPDEAPPGGLGVSRIDAGARVPLGAGVARGIALDSLHATAEALLQSAGALEPGGRLLAPIRTTMPAGLTVLARDDRWWVAERPPTAAVVSLTTARRG